MTRRLIVLLVILLAAAAVYFLRPAAAPSAPDAAKRTTDTKDEAAHLVGRGDAASDDPDAARDAADEGTDEGDADVAEGMERRRTLHIRVLVGDEPAPAGVRVLLRATTGEQKDYSPGAWSREGRTDEQGTVRFEVAVGEHGWLCAWTEGHAPAVKRWHWYEGGEEDPLVVTLEHGFAFDGRVVDAVTGKPIPEAVVVLDTRAGGLDLGPSDEAGRFHVPGVAADAWSHLKARAPGYTPCELTLVIDNGRLQPAAPVLRMRHGGTITGTVRAPDGLPIGPAEVRFWKHDEGPWTFWTPESLLRVTDVSEGWLESQRAGRWASCAVTGPDGSFRVEDLDLDETYDVTARAAGYAQSAAVEVGVTASAPEVRIDLALRRGGRVLLHVVPPESAGLPAEMQVLVFHESHPFTPDEEEAPGRYVFGAVDPGPAHGFVCAEGLPSAVVPIEVREGETVEAEIHLVAGNRIEGVVLDPDGKPYSGAQVEAAPVAWNLRATADTLRLDGGRRVSSDAEGRFVITGLPPGDVFLVAYDQEDDDVEPGLGTPERVRCTPPARDVRLVLARRGGLRLRLLAPSGSPYGGPVEIEVEDEDTSGWWADELEEGGVFRLSGLADGEYRLVVTPHDLAWVARRVRIERGQVVDLGDVVLGPGVTVSGGVVDDTGAPVAGADIDCNENGDRHAVTDEDGRFSLDAFPDGGFTLYAWAPGHMGEDVDVRAGATTGLRIVLQRAVRVRGTLVLPEGEGPPGLWIEFRLPGAGAETHEETQEDGTTRRSLWYEGAQYLRVDADGRFDGDVKPGAYVGWLRDPSGGERRLGEWTFEAAQTYELEITPPAK